jgi:hypothetical protein
MSIQSNLLTNFVNKDAYFPKKSDFICFISLATFACSKDDDKKEKR